MYREPESEFLKRMLASADRTEALDWLLAGDGNNNIGEMTAAESISMVMHLFSLGAVEVYVAKLSINDTYSSTNNLIVGLNDSVETREAIFAWFSRMANRQGFLPYTDEGQRYLLAWFG